MRLTGTTTSSQNEPEKNRNNGLTQHYPGQKIHYWMQCSVIHRTTSLLEGVLLLYKAKLDYKAVLETKIKSNKWVIC